MGKRGAIFARRDDARILEYAPMQESSAAKLIEFVEGVYTVVDKTGAPSLAKGVRIKKDSAGGNLRVHLADDPAGEYEDYDFEGGDKEGLIFDSVIETGTNITLTDVKILI